MSEELEKLKMKLQSFEAVKTNVLKDDAIGITGDVIADTESVIEHMSRSKTQESRTKNLPAIIIKSRKITINMIPEPHRDAVLGSISFRHHEQSDEAIEVVEHRAIVSGMSSYVDANAPIPELCPFIYEVFVEDQETHLMAEDRVVEVIMIGDNYGIIKGSPSDELDYEDPKKGDKKGDKKGKKGKYGKKGDNNRKFRTKGGIVKPLKTRNDSKWYSKDLAEGVFPEVNGQKFMMPIQPRDPSRTKEFNTTSYSADFWQPRGSGIHGSVDLFGRNIGTGGKFRADQSIYGEPVVAVADGELRVSFAGKSWDNNMARFAAVLRKKYKTGQLLKDIADRYGQKYADRCIRPLKRPIPNTWDALKKWGHGMPWSTVLKGGSLMDKLSGNNYYNKQGGFWWSNGGREAYLYTDKDQKGNSFYIVYSHLSKIATFDPSRKIVKGKGKNAQTFYRVKRGEIIGYVGNSALWVNNNNHLHFSVRAHPWSPTASQKALADFQRKGRSVMVYYYVPARIIPGMVGAKIALYSK